MAAVPERAARIIAFLNTHDIDRGQDVLATPAGFEAWLSQERAFAGPRPSDRETEAARALREGFRDLVAHHGGADATRSLGIDTLNGWLARYPVRFALDADGVLDAPWPTAGVAEALGALVAAVALCQASVDWARVKVCQNPDCR